MTNKVGRPQKIHFFGFNAGNGALKLVGKDFERRIISYKSNEYIPDVEGSVLVDGVGFTVGEQALYGLQLGRRTVDDVHAKTQDLDSLYLGALAHYDNLTSVMHNKIVLSSHAYSSMKEELKKQLSKPERIVVLAGKEVRLTTELLMIVPEGYGAVYHLLDKLATLDIGRGTSILTPYSTGKPGKERTSPIAVETFYEIIYEKMRKFNGGIPGNIEAIQFALEKRSFNVQYKGNAINIEEIYQDSLQEWWKALLPMINHAKDMQSNNCKIYCIGGGVALPRLAGKLQEVGFNPVKKSPEMVDARGLYDIALKRGASNA
jgi:hypothetical protein